MDHRGAVRMSIADVNDVKGGEYELVAAQFDKILSKPGEPFDFKRYRQGDRVTLDVEEAKRLWLAGAIVEPGARQRAAAEAARQQYEAALAALPDEIREQVLADQAGVFVDGAGESQSGAPEEPPKGALKPAWVDYAVALGWDRDAAEALRKPDLQKAIWDAKAADDAASATEPETPESVSGEGDSVTGDGDSESEADADADADAPKPLPLNTAPHEAWVAAAIERGIDADAAEKYTVQELINLLS
ncbi:hypothetical protein CH267_00945 [Rhodococcus sp. 06-621-2]|nr:hypothetical protein CH267_00945 [Rhodococcus sp. 06-621-2]